MSSHRDPFGLIGTTIDRRYEVKRMVAEGGFGVVYEAESIALKMPVAIKVLKITGQTESDKAFEARFLQEARVLARLKHSAIVGVSDGACLPDGTPYIVLEWIHGETLEAFVERVGPLPIDEAMKILGPVANALDFAHQNGVIHRDLKPGNIMVSRNGPRVLDFGLARWGDIHAIHTSTIDRTGLTVGFAAPEQYGPEFGEVSPRTDVFSFAGVLFFALTGHPPFRGESITSVMYATCFGDKRPDLFEYRRELPESLRALIGRQFSVKSTERAQSIPDFFRAAERIVFEETPSGPPTDVQDAPVLAKEEAAPVATLPERHDIAFAHTMRDTRGSTDPPLPPASPPVSPTQNLPLPSLSSHKPPVSSRPIKAREQKVLAIVLLGSVVLFGVAFAFVFGPLFAGVSSSTSASSSTRAQVVQSATTSVTASSPTSSSTASSSTKSSAELGPCGALHELEACVVGGRFRKGPEDCDALDPAHKAACPPLNPRMVKIESFVMDKREASVSDYAACVRAGDCKSVGFEKSDPELPMRGLSHSNAAAYCAFRKKRLPTDDEWESAAAGFVHREFPWGNSRPNAASAVFSDEGASHDHPEPVAFLGKPTPEGIINLAGNIAEWTATDAPREAPDPAVPLFDADPAEKRYWVRGGSYQSPSLDLHTWVREAYPESVGLPTIGVRCARSLGKK